MAFSKSKSTEQLVGLNKLQVFDLNFASVTSGDVVTGLDHIYSAVFNNQTSEAQGIVVPNVDTDGTTSKPGAIHISGVTASDLGQLTVIGR